MRGAARWIPIVLLLPVLISLAPRALRLGDVDPRGRASWTAPPLTVDNAPQDVELFVPACDMRALVLHAEPSAQNQRVSAEFLLHTADRGTTRAGSATAVVQPDGRVVMPLDGVPLAWRAPMVMRLRAVDQPVSLDARRPIVFEPSSTSRLGTLACVAGAGDIGAGWLSAGALIVIALASVGLGAAWIQRACSGRAAYVSLTSVAMAAAVVMTSATLATYAVVVPPFEPADELAHFQYARFVATTGTLPIDVPEPGSEWRASSYEFVQQPLYYIGAAQALNVTGLATPGPDLTDNPRSRMRPGGTEPTIFQRARGDASSTAHRGLLLLRAFSVLLAIATTVIVARLAMTVTNDALVVATVAGGLGLIPQWCSVMGSVSTDPPATLLAAAATLAIVGLTQSHDGSTRARHRWCLVTGLLIGAAYATKATAVFLAPMAALACVLETATRARAASTASVISRLGRAVVQSIRPMLWIGLGILITGAWVAVRAWFVFGDPQAFEFKKAILEAGGFVPVAGPMPWTAEFWSHMRVMVFEPFWARFGSLGAGPFPGSRVWVVYAAASMALALIASAGVVGWLTGPSTIQARVSERRDGLAGIHDARKPLAVAVCALGVGLGLLAWLAVNLLPRADMVVHWTPRHIMPMTAPAALLVAAGLDWLLRARPAVRLVTASAVGVLLPALAVAWIGVLRATILMFHFGY